MPKRKPVPLPKRKPIPPPTEKPVPVNTDVFTVQFANGAKKTLNLIEVNKLIQSEKMAYSNRNYAGRVVFTKTFRG